MTAAGVARADSHAVATVKLAEWRQMQTEIAAKVDGLRARADALGVKHGPDTAYDELLADVVEREAIQGELGSDGYDTYERDIESGLTRADIDELNRLASEQLGPEHGEGPRAFDVPEGREPAAGAAQDGREPAEGATGGGPGAAGAGGGLEAVRGTGETVARGLAAHTEEDAITAGLTQGFGDLPEYQRLSMREQAAQVFEFVNRDYEAAKRVAMGTEAPPPGLLPESVYVGVEKRALREGDVETIRQLATRSRLSTEATTMGQRIRTLGERDRSSPVGALQDIQRAREAAFERGGANLEAAKAATVAEIKAEARDAASPPGAFANFMKSLECD